MSDRDKLQEVADKLCTEDHLPDGHRRDCQNFSSAAKRPVLPLGTLERGLYRE